MRIAVVGTGYVGLGTGAVFADLGNQVVRRRYRRREGGAAAAGELPIFEPGLEELLARNLAGGAAHASPPTTPQALPERRLRLHLRRHARRGRTAGPTCATCGAAADRDRPSTWRAGRPHDRRQQEHDADRLGRPGRPTPERRVGRAGARFAVVSQPRVPARGLGGARLPAPRPGRARLDRPRRRRARSPSSTEPLDAPIADHRHADGGDDQVRLQRLPGDQDLLHQRDRRRSASARRRRAPGRAQGMGYDQRIGAALPRRGDRLRRLLLPEGRAGAGAHGRGGRLPPAAPARGDGDQPRRAPRSFVRKLRPAARRPATDRTIGVWGWPSSRTPTTCARRRRWTIIHLLTRGAPGARLRPGGDGRRARAPRRASPSAPTPTRRRPGRDAVVLVTRVERVQGARPGAGARRDAPRRCSSTGATSTTRANWPPLGFTYRGVGLPTATVPVNVEQIPPP